MLKKLILIILMLLCGIQFVSCGKGSFSSFKSKFMNQYNVIVQDVFSNDVNDILKKLQSDENAKILDNMSQLLRDNNDLRKSHKKEYDKLQDLYTGLTDLKNAYGNWESYDLDKQKYLNEQILSMNVYLSRLEYEENKDDN